MEGMLVLKNSDKIIAQRKQELEAIKKLLSYAKEEIPANNIMNEQQKKEFLNTESNYISKKNNSNISNSYSRIRTCADTPMRSKK